MRSGLDHPGFSIVDPGRVELIPAMPEHEPLLSNLLQLYIYDFSEIIPLELQADGRFAYSELPLYWSEPSRFPFLAAVDGAWAGFAFVRQTQGSAESRPVWDMVEFFVLRGHRHRGIGTRLAQLAFARFPGDWQVRVMDVNTAAEQFWRSAIERFTGAPTQPVPTKAGGAMWHVFRFESRQ